MSKQKPKFFDGATIFLIIVLLTLILIISGMLFWKEKNISLDFKFFNQLEVTKEANQITKGDKIIISFSGPVQMESVLGNLVFEPKLNFESNWLNNHQLQLVIKDNLAPDFNYRLKIKSFKSKWGMNNKSQEKIFSTDPLPKLKSFYPAEGQAEIKIKEEISFEFENNLPSQYYLTIKTEPSFEFEDIQTADKNKMIIKPVTNLAFETEYFLTVEIKSRNYPDFERKILETSFKTERPPVVIYGWDENGVSTKTENRLELLEPSIKTGKYLDIDLSDQNLYIFENGRELGAYKISSGLRGMNTPSGNFEVIGKARRPWSVKYGLFMPWFIQFTYDGHGIHELPEWPGGYKEGANHLGIPVSHGCVRLGVGPAQKVYDFVERGTPIVIHY